MLFLKNRRLSYGAFPCKISVLGNGHNHHCSGSRLHYYGIIPQSNVLVFGTRLLNEGREYIEAPRWADILIVVSVLLFLLNCFMTVLKTKKWTGIQGVLLGGLVFLALMYLPGLFYTKSMVKDQFWWWWVVHLWVEGHGK